MPDFPPPPPPPPPSGIPVAPPPPPPPPPPPVEAFAPASEPSSVPPPAPPPAPSPVLVSAPPAASSPTLPPASPATLPLPPAAPKPKSLLPLFLALGLLLIAGLGATVWFVVLPKLKGGISSSELRTQALALAEGPSMSLANFKTEELVLEDGSVSGTFTASAIAGESLYEKLDARVYLRESLNLGEQLNALQSLRSELAGPDGARLLELAGVEALPPDPFSSVLLKVSCAKGSEFSFNGSYLAVKKDGKTELQVQGAYSDNRPTGKKRSEFPSEALVVGEASTETSLRSLVTRHANLALKIASAREKLAEEERRNTSGRSARFNALLTPGSFFSSSFQSTASSEPVRIWLEITEADPAAKTLKALLRNDGSWDETRALEGSWSFDPEVRVLSLTLSSPASLARRDCGPLLSDAGALALKVSAKASDLVLTSQIAGTAVVFTSLPASGVDAIKTSLLEERNAVLGLLSKGSLFQGTAYNKRRKTSESLVLSVGALASDGSSISVVLTSLKNTDWKRSLTGSLVLGKYRSAGSPLHLQLSKADAVRKGASPDSVFGTTLELSPTLAVSAEGLSGEDDRFTYKLQPITAQDFAKLRSGVSTTSDSAKSSSGVADSARAASASSVAASASADPVDLPDFPEQPGAYILKGGAWLALPSNGAKIGTSAAAVVGQIGSFLGSLGKSQKQASDAKTADLDFDGSTPQPRVLGQAVTLLYVGPLDVLPAEDLERYSALREAPALEVAPSYLKNGSKRHVDLVRLAPGYVGFGSKRRSAVLETPFEGVTLLRCQGRLSDGYYAFGVRAKATPAFEFIVQN